jgi:hypothetical protein
MVMYQADGVSGLQTADLIQKQIFAPNTGPQN